MYPLQAFFHALLFTFPLESFFSFRCLGREWTVTFTKELKRQSSLSRCVRSASLFIGDRRGRRKILKRLYKLVFELLWTLQRGVPPHLSPDSDYVVWKM